MKIPLTISADYQPGWGLYEAVRAIAQNMRDRSNAYHVSYHADDERVWFVTPNAELPLSSLLMGSSEPITDHRRYGEGMKLAALVLSRWGRNFVVRTDGEVWRFGIEEDDRFGVPVLTAMIEPGEEQTDVTVEFSVTPDEWAEISKRFLWMGPVDSLDLVSGRILLDSDRSGQLYQDGNFVTCLPDAMLGYDLPNVTLDRDRRMVEPFILGWEMGRVWGQALETFPDIASRLILDSIQQKRNDVGNLFQQGDDDVDDVTCVYGPGQLSDAESKTLADVSKILDMPFLAADFIYPTKWGHHTVFGYAIPLESLQSLERAVVAGAYAKSPLDPETELAKAAVRMVKV